MGNFLSNLIVVTFLFTGFSAFAGTRSQCDVTDESKILNNPELVALMNRIRYIIAHHEELRKEKQNAISQLEGIQAARSVGVGVSGYEENQLKQVVVEGTNAEAKESVRGMCDDFSCHCDTNAYKDQVFNQIRQICAIESAQNNCRQITYSSAATNSVPSNSSLDGMQIEDAMGFDGKLTAAIDVLAANLNRTRDSITVCENALNGSLLSDSCKDAYSQAFRSLDEQTIGERCTEEFISGDVHYSLKSLLIEEMRGFAQDSCKVMETHITNKTVERQIYNRVQSLKATRSCLNHLNPEKCRAEHLSRQVANQNQ